MLKSVEVGVSEWKIKPVANQNFVPNGQKAPNPGIKMVDWHALYVNFVGGADRPPKACRRRG